MKSHIQFLTTPTVDTNGTALMLNFDHQRYLIGNIHEGTQRACMERGAKLAKLSGIFLTGKTEWKNTGGLIGMILTIADVTQSGTEAIRAAIKEKVEKRALRLSRMTPKELAKQPNYDYVPPKKPEKHTMTIHGGPNITHTLATARRFIFRKGTPIDVDEFTELDEEHREESTWSDRHIRVWTMSIDPSTNKDPVTHKSPQSSRKRSFDEYKENDHLQKDRSLVEEADRNQQLRRAVVCDMFDSDWRLDALVETPISQVNMPATLFVRNPETKAIEKYSGPLPGSGESLPDLNVLVRKPWPGTLIADLPPTRPSEASLSYIIRNHPQRGKFILQKAKELNVDVRHFKDLAEGKTVTSLDGKEVLPEQVLEKGKPGTGFAIIDLPSTEYVQGLVNRSEWKVDDIMTGVEMMIWILGPGVGQDPALRKFMIDFSHLKHIVSSQDHCPNSLTMDSCSAATIRRNQIDPDRYSVPIHSNSPSRKEDGDVGLYSVPETITASRGLTIDLEPFLVIKEETSVQPLNTAEILKESGRDVKLLAKVIGQDIASEKVQTELENQNLPSPEAEMIFLGTGSAMPSKYRNVSATLLRVPGSGSYLLDCGENTLGQLSRVYTSDELLEVLRDLKMIWISHLHADHHLGIASVIKAWYQAVYGKDYKPEDSADVTHRERCSNPVKTISEQKRLFVASDDAMLHWLAEYASVEDFGYAKLIPLKVVAARPHAPDSTELYWEEIPLDFKQTDTELAAALRIATGLTDIAAANVVHCHGAKAVSLTFPTGFKFSYSGDCRPSRAFAAIGQGSTVLLHEATFDDELAGDARAKRHSTNSEAIGMGFAMKARRVMLTHFSQRYQKIPNMDDLEGQALDLTAEEESINGDPMNGMGTMTVDTDTESHLGDVPDNSHVPTRHRSSSRRGSANSSGSGGVRVRQYIHSPSRRSQAEDMKVGVAFDYMRVKVKDIAILEKFTPVLLKLYDKEASVGGKGETSKGIGMMNSRRTDKLGDEKRRVPQSEEIRNDIREGRALFDEADMEVSTGG